MPKALERRLKTAARKHHFGKRRTDAFVYGTLRKTGWKPAKRKRSRRR